MHGGDVYRNKVHTDFSVNVNPLGIPEQIREELVNSMQCVQAYPDERCEELRGKLSAHYGIKPENVLCGNGASELLLAICRWKRPKRALLLAPGFLGYRRALKAQECRITHFFLRKEEDFALTQARVAELEERIRSGAYDRFFLANPANPTGRLTELESVRKLAKACGETGTVMVLDESFMELTNDPESHTFTKEFLEYQNVLVVRSFTKTFAIPGIRLGYVLCADEKTTGEIALQCAEWSVSIPAQAAGVAAMEQEGYLKASKSFIRSQRAYLEEGLRALGVKVFPSDANFLLFQWKDGDLYEKLLSKGILIRDCSDYEGLGKGYYRIAVRNRMENAALLQELEAQFGSRK